MSESGPITPVRLIQILQGLSVPINAQLAAILARLDVALSTRASEATVAGILAQLDVALSTLAAAAQLPAALEAGRLAVQDSGLNTNPRRYELDNGFRSPVVARAGGVATPLWTVATTPARTAGRITVVYTLTIENVTGGAVTAWLEIGGVAITIPFHVVNVDSIVIDFVAGLRVGDNDVNCNASANGVNFHIAGIEA